MKSFRFDTPHADADGLDAYVGDRLLFERDGANAVWEIVGVHVERPMLIAKSPD